MREKRSKSTADKNNTNNVVNTVNVCISLFKLGYDFEEFYTEANIKYGYF